MFKVPKEVGPIVWPKMLYAGDIRPLTPVRMVVNLIAWMLLGAAVFGGAAWTPAVIWLVCSLALSQYAKTRGDYSFQVDDSGFKAWLAKAHEIADRR